MMFQKNGMNGMTNVKWVARITAIEAPFTGYQQTAAYRLRQSPEEPGEPVTRMAPSQQDIQTLHGVVTAIVEGRKGPEVGAIELA